MVASLHPPIRQSTTVRADRAHTFQAFVRRLGDWWPTRTHSLGLIEVTAVHVEEALGGSVYEVWADGSTREWGKIIVWEPPERFALTWHTLSQPTEVEVVFRDLGPSLTRVELEHRGWERLPADEVAAMTAPETGYPHGWQRILALFTTYAEASTET